MIKYPKNWRGIGCKVSSEEIALTVRKCLQEIAVRNLSLSGGIDSTLLLYFMKEELGDPIHCYTIALNEYHPDYIHAKLATEFYNVVFHPCFLGEQKEPDEIVRIFYNQLNSDGVKEIIAGDGIDEFTCGYYSHQQDQSEQNYISWIRRLNPEHLMLLNENSGDVQVYLPYLSPDVISLLSLVPIYEKVDSVHRKKIIIEMATGNVSGEIINRWKYGFCDASSRKDLR